MDAGNQGAYMEYAQQIARTNFQFVGDRNRMPIYPGLLAFFDGEGMSDEEFFERGKNVGIVIGLAVVVVAFLMFRKVSEPVDALVGTLVATFTVLVYKSPYFQAEALFYGVNLVLFGLLLSLVRQPPDANSRSCWPCSRDRSSDESRPAGSSPCRGARGRPRSRGRVARALRRGGAGQSPRCVDARQVGVLRCRSAGLLPDGYVSIHPHEQGALWAVLLHMDPQRPEGSEGRVPATTSQFG